MGLHGFITHLRVRDSRSIWTCFRLREAARNLLELALAFTIPSLVILTSSGAMLSSHDLARDSELLQVARPRRTTSSARAGVASTHCPTTRHDYDNDYFATAGLGQYVKRDTK